MSRQMAENITDLTGRVAVVIGGTSGLGRAIAVGLARSGAKLVPAGRREQLVKDVCAEIRREGGEALERTVDVSARSSIDKLRDAARERFQREVAEARRSPVVAQTPRPAPPEARAGIQVSGGSPREQPTESDPAHPAR